MRFEIRADERTAAEFLRDYVQRRLRPALERFTPQMTRVAVEVGDANGPRGGIDKYCRITAHVVRLGDVFAESADSDVGVAIDRAIDRVERAVAKTIVRARARNSESVRVPEEGVEQT